MLREQREELDAVWARIVDASVFVGGAEVDRFECDWATACGTRFAIGVGNGTDAIAVTLRALDWGMAYEDETGSHRLGRAATAWLPGHSSSCSDWVWSHSR